MALNADLQERFDGRLIVGTGWFETYYPGQRVALLGTGAEAAAILPEVLHTAESVTFFPEGTVWVTPIDVPGRTLRRLVARSHLRCGVRDRWQRRQLTPHRFDVAPTVVSPNYFAALRDPRTRVVHWPAYAIVRDGIRSADGVEYRVDTIIVGDSSQFADLTTPDPTTAADSTSPARRPKKQSR